MFRSPFLRTIVLLSIGTIILFPVYTIFFQQPSYEKLLKENTENEAIRTATHLSSFLIQKHELRKETLPVSLMRQIEILKTDSHFVKIRIFSPSGEILYSSDPREIGMTNEEPYFQEIVTAGKARTQEVLQNSQSFERQIMPADVVETYIPIVREDRLIGVFEIYYDITAEKKKLAHVINRSSGMVFVMAVVLLCAVLLTAVRATKYLAAREKAERDREQVILELQTALGEIKRLSGLLPICSSCKKIRDDRGYWSQIETYISEHSEAQFSHGICPDCARKLYPDFYKEEQ